MESRILHLFLKAVALAAIAVLFNGCASRPPLESADSSRPVIDPDIERRDIREADIDTENFEAGVYVGFMSIEDFGTDTVYGARLAYHLTESFFVEANYGQSDAGRTSFEVLSGGADLLTGDARTYKYYDLSVGYNLLPGEVFFSEDWAFNSALYLIAGVGNTDFANDNFFTLVFGAGYRVLATDWLALHFDVRDHLFDSDLLGQDKTTHNIEFTLGLTSFF